MVLPWSSLLYFRRHRIAQMVILALVSLFVYLTDPMSVQWMMVLRLFQCIFTMVKRGVV